MYIIKKPYKECLTNEHAYPPDKKVLGLPNKQYNLINIWKFKTVSYSIWYGITKITSQNEVDTWVMSFA